MFRTSSKWKVLRPCSARRKKILSFSLTRTHATHLFFCIYLFIFVVLYHLSFAHTQWRHGNKGVVGSGVHLQCAAVQPTEALPAVRHRRPPHTKDRARLSLDHPRTAGKKLTLFPFVSFWPPPLTQRLLFLFFSFLFFSFYLGWL